MKETKNSTFQNKRLFQLTIASLSIIILVVFTSGMPNIHSKRNKLKQTLDIQPYVKNSSADKIYFLNTGHSDAIVLESGGKFAMIDAGEDSDNPTGRAELNFRGYEKEVLYKSHFRFLFYSI